MRKNTLFRGILCALVSLVTLSSASLAMPVRTFAATPTYTVSTIDQTKTGSVTLYKLVENNGTTKNGTGAEETVTQAKLSGAVFSYLKIADIDQITDSTGKTGTYYINMNADFKALATTLGVKFQSTTIGGKETFTTDQMQTNIEAMRNAGVGENSGEVKLNTLADAGTAMTATDKNGMTTAAKMPLGLYLFGEKSFPSNVAAIAQPFLLSIPMTNVVAIDGHAAGTVWQYDVTAYPKDQTINVTKDVIDESVALVKVDDRQIGKVFSEVLTSDIPKLQAGQTNKTYSITDNMVNEVYMGNVNVYIGTGTYNTTSQTAYTKLTEKTDYTVTGTAKQSNALTVTLTESGLKKLDGQTAARKLFVVFDAALTESAKIGVESGNTNKPTLTYQTNVSTTRTFQGNEVKIYTYEADVTKTMTTGAVTNVKFNVFETQADGTKAAAPIKFIKSADGVYTVWDATDAGTDAVTEISPSSTGLLKIKGLDNKKYVLTEVATASGAQLMRDDITLTLVSKAGEGDNAPAKTGALDAATSVASGTDAVQKITDTTNLGKGIAAFSIRNNTAMPDILRTGGEGTIFKTTMGILTLCAAFGVILYAKKRRSVVSE